MSEQIPESIPTSQDPRSKRPMKKRALGPIDEQAKTVEALFAKPDVEIKLPSSTISTFKAPAPPEIVANVQGSSAGAGSGEFHVYKASRRREYERLRAMDDEVRKEKDGEAFERERREREERDAEKTRKNREKREKLKARKGKKGGQNVKTGGIKARVDENGETIVPEAGIDVDRVAPRGETEAVGVIIHDDD